MDNLSSFIFHIILALGAINICRCVDFDVSKDKCKFSGNYRHAYSNFLECSIKSAEPVKYCTDCSYEYFNLTMDYRQLLNDSVCRNIYIDNDRLNILQTTYTSAKDLWNAGTCSECFECNLDTTDHMCNKTNTTIEFENLMNRFENCSTFNKDQNMTDVCFRCKERYDDVNLMYNSIRQKRGENICFDIKDMMNKTRIKWSRDFHCCEDRNASQFYFHILASTFSFIVVLFYLGIFVVSKHQERSEYDPINDGEEPSTSHEPGHGAEANVPMPSSSRSDLLIDGIQHRYQDDVANDLGRPEVLKPQILHSHEAATSHQLFM